MDIKIVNFIKKYKITDLEMQDMINTAPMLEHTSFNEFVANCKLLVGYGYPAEDLDFLLLSNPKIFARANKELNKDLINLTEKYDDIELVLKAKPTII